MTSHESQAASNHRPLDCVFNSLCGPTSKKHQSPHYWPCVTGEFPAQRASNAKKASIWWRHQVYSNSIEIWFYCNSIPGGDGRIRLLVSTVNRTYELSGIIHVTPFPCFRKYGKHSTGPSIYGPWVRTYSKLFSCKSVFTIFSYKAQSNEICTYGRVSRGSLPRVRRYDWLYLWTVEYDQCR